MNVFGKIKNSWWVVLSFIMGLNGLGFIYIGSKYNNKNWIIEGVMYEVPWVFFFIYWGIYGFHSMISINPTNTVSLFAELLMFVSIIRSFWVAIKLWHVYDNYDKYSQNPTEVNNPKKVKENDKFSNKSICCLGIVIIFFIVAIITFF